MMRNPKMTSVYVLNDPVVARRLNKEVDDQDLFHPLPDPVPILPMPPESVSLREHCGIDSERTLFLFFGTISERKGVYRVLEALERLQSDIQRRVAILFLGQLKKGQEEAIRRAVKRVKDLDRLQVRVDFRFVEPVELALALRDCDVVLVPYQRAEGSSGVIGHAAQAGKPVIGPQSGLIGELIRDYELGKAIDTVCAEEIAKGISAFVRETRCKPASAYRGEEYVRERSPTLFVKTLLRTE